MSSQQMAHSESPVWSHQADLQVCRAGHDQSSWDLKVKRRVTAWSPCHEQQRQCAACTFRCPFSVLDVLNACYSTSQPCQLQWGQLSHKLEAQHYI